MHNTGIYAIRNVLNGKRYIGSARLLKARHRQHVRRLTNGNHHSAYLQRAWNKYGASSFVFETVLYCDTENLLSYEQSLIDGIQPEYNIVKIAGSQLGYKHTPETRQKMSVARRRNPSSPRKGMAHSLESKKLISKSKTGIKIGPYSKDRIEKTAARMRASVSSIDEAKVRQIRELKKQRYSATKIGKIIGCTHHVVYDICRGRTWGWVI